MEWLVDRYNDCETLETILHKFLPGKVYELPNRDFDPESDEDDITNPKNI